MADPKGLAPKQNTNRLTSDVKTRLATVGTSDAPLKLETSTALTLVPEEESQ